MAASPETAEDRRRQYLSQMGDAAQALSDIIANVLDLSKIEAGKLELETVPFDLGELLRGMQRAYVTLAEPKPIALHLELGAGAEGMVAGDLLRTRQILNNFLGNALKFTAMGEVPVGGALLRSGARPGDALVVTGPLGRSRDGHHLRFAPRWREGIALAASGMVRAISPFNSAKSTSSIMTTNRNNTATAPT